MADNTMETLDAQLTLRIEHLSKTFPGQRALDDVSLEIRRGEIHALCGQNGSGKSTLIKALSGFHKPDPGSCEAWLLGSELALGTLTADERRQIKFSHQDLALLPNLSIRENLGLEWPRRKLLSPFHRRAERTATRRLLSTFDVDLDPDTLVGELSPFEKSAVAISRAIGDADDVRLLVLDEPTASLGAAEAQSLFRILRMLKERGVATLYVSHFLPDVLEIADRISVLRDGRRVGTREASTLNEDGLVELIVGSRVERATALSEDVVVDTHPPLVLDRLSGDGFTDVSFRVRAGEVVGLTGLIGSGYEKVPQALAGAVAIEAGEVELNGARYSKFTPKSAITAGLTSVPADRRSLGLIPHFTLRENLTLPSIGESWRGGFIRRSVEEKDAGEWLRVTGVTPPDPERLVEELSGGNQQKAMLAKALRLEPEVLVLAEPTQAVDVGAAASIRRLITNLAERGQCVLVSTADPEELEEICGRVLVMRGGRLAAEIVGDQITQDRILFESQFEGGSVPAGGAI